MQAPFVWNAQDFWLSETRPRVTALDRLGKKFLCRSASLIIANSKATCEHLPRSDKLRVVHNGILIERYEPSTAAAQDFRRRYQIPGQSPLVRMAARMRSWKGHRSLLTMASQVLAYIQGLMRALPAEMEASDRIHLLLNPRQTLSDWAAEVIQASNGLVVQVT